MIVVDMDMPRSCFECKLNDDYVVKNEYANRCLVNDKKIENMVERPDWCPIVGEVEPQESEGEG